MAVRIPGKFCQKGETVDRNVVTKSFDTLHELAEKFGGTVYRDPLTDALLVQDDRHNCWHRYAWAQGQREISYRETLRGEELPLLVQIYPTF